MISESPIKHGNGGGLRNLFIDPDQALCEARKPKAYKLAVLDLSNILIKYTSEIIAPSLVVKCQVVGVFLGYDQTCLYGNQTMDYFTCVIHSLEHHLTSH